MCFSCSCVLKKMAIILHCLLASTAGPAKGPFLTGLGGLHLKMSWHRACNQLAAWISRDTQGIAIISPDMQSAGFICYLLQSLLWYSCSLKMSFLLCKAMASVCCSLSMCERHYF